MFQLRSFWRYRYQSPQPNASAQAVQHEEKNGAFSRTDLLCLHIALIIVDPDRYSIQHYIKKPTIIKINLFVLNVIGL